MAEKKETITVTADELQQMVAAMVAAQMAEVKEKKDELPEEVRKNQERVKEEVEIELFYDGEKYKDPVYVGINGKGYLIKRGEKVKVPVAIAEILQQSAEQNKIARGLVREAEQKLEEFNKE